LPNDGGIVVKITCLPDGRTVDIEPSETILNADLRANIPHAHACGGKAKCSTCRVAIVDGLDNCPPRNELEDAMALRLGFAPEVRLACQTRPRGGVTFRRLVLDEILLLLARALLVACIGLAMLRPAFHRAGAGNGDLAQLGA